MLSVNLSLDPSHVKYDWKRPFELDQRYWLPEQFEEQPSDLETIADAISYYAWSPSLFKDGTRLIDHFESAQFIGLDFDEGDRLAWAIDHFKHFACIIGTTRNHRIEKRTEKGTVKPACDRFRVLIKLAGRITSSKDYSATASKLISFYKTDKACKDAARFFFPCRDIVFVGKDKGSRLPIERYKQPPKYEPKPRIDGDPKGGAIAALLAGRGFDEGQRHEALVAAAWSITNQTNYSREQAIAYLLSKTNKEEKEVVAIVNSAYRKCGR